ncbi:translation initiation factor IF-2 N-terminal domain-containing protein [Pseudenhygromyxa sp. WMMC2535]|uniref:translation initiation factor IF-2 n=1 Tax=Pseudenhygromyxa sp. WMMC2535 TaxID=2712867 RepID=UPI0015580C74|nr:translation initiation factor IF-2 N-terminal domain-containing protein [Pseudenhygromyxa sp. WMMC2535]NVB38485.1 translation initiation factor IF-2 N-terminal domain-containing protein [Pseudenhygromyxa sp. WMMC2535]
MSKSPKQPRETDAPPAPASSSAPSQEQEKDEGRAIRNDDGVIVGSRGAGPKILGFVDLKSRAGGKAEGGDKTGKAGKTDKTATKAGAKGKRGGKAPGPKREVVIEQGSADQPKGRASARKAREIRSFRHTPGRRPVKRSGKPSSAGTAEMSAEKKRIRVDEVIAIAELAKQMGVKAPKVIRILWNMGIRDATLNSSVDVETAELVAAEFGYRVEDVSFDESELIEDEELDEEELGEARAPVIAVLGHVDHGKTTLLDRLRKAEVAAGEAGGITQHVGAYRVETPSGPMVFVDTPGHAAFTAMRERGARLTDIAILIVAADDGIMPTTVEAIEQIRAADVPFIVVANKCDLPTADVARVERQLMEHQLLTETYGGELPIVRISAKTGEGLDDLLEQISMLAELLELRALNEGRASGVVLESRVDKGRGVIATVLVQGGVLSRGDIIVAGESSGRASALVPCGDLGEADAESADAGAKKKKDNKKKKDKKKKDKKDKKGGTSTVQSCGPSSVVELAGFDEPPPVGIAFHVVEDDKAAKQLVGHRREQRKRREGSASAAPSFADRLAAERRGELPTIALVVRADVQGSLEAIEQVIAELSSEKVSTKVISTGVGAITEGDIKLATTARQSGSNVTPAIFGFGVKAAGKVAALADTEGIPIRTSKVIYELGEQLEALMVAQLEPSYVEHPVGKAEVRKLFPTSTGVVCGCRIVDGKVTRASKIRVRRGGEEVATTNIASLRIVNRDVREVGLDQECGILLGADGQVEEGDVLEAFELEAIPPSL